MRARRPQAYAHSCTFMFMFIVLNRFDFKIRGIAQHYDRENGVECRPMIAILIELRVHDDNAADPHAQLDTALNAHAHPWTASHK